MTARARNVITGIVVLGAIFIFLWMVLKFTGRATAAFAGKGVPITIVASRGDGVSEGTQVLYLGYPVGKINTITRSDDNLHVRMAAEVDQHPPLPHNLTATIHIQSMLGASSIVELQVSGPPTGQLDAGEEIIATYAGSQLLPPEFNDVLTDLRRQKLIQHTDETIVEMRAQLRRAGDVMTSFQQIVGDPKVQNNIRDAVANMKQATERANRVGENLEKFTNDLQKVSMSANDTITEMHKTIDRTGGDVDDLTRHLTDDVDKMGKVLDQFQQVAAKINSGKGTAGQILNDPALYDQLTDTAKELDLVAKSLHRLVDQWEQEGLHLKVR